MKKTTYQFGTRCNHIGSGSFVQKNDLPLAPAVQFHLDTFESNIVKALKGKNLLLAYGNA